MKTRNPIRRCGKRYETREDAWRSKAAQHPDAEVRDCRCGGFHVVKPRCITASRAAIFPAAESPAPPKVKKAARKPIKPVSDKRRAESRVRAALADRLWPDRREGTVMCGCGRPECHRPADDLHEPLSRARGGSITDEANAIPLSRHCHDEITFSPESELQWAYDAGLLRHSWDAPKVPSDEVIAASVAAITPEDAAELLGSLRTGGKR